MAYRRVTEAQLKAEKLERTEAKRARLANFVRFAEALWNLEDTRNSRERD